MPVDERFPIAELVLLSGLVFVPDIKLLLKGFVFVPEMKLLFDVDEGGEDEG